MLISRLQEDIANDDKQSALEYLENRQYVRAKFWQVVFCIAFVLIYISLPFLIHSKKDMNPEEYAVKEETKLLVDSEMLLDTSERSALLEQIYKTYGGYYYLYFYEVNCDEFTDVFNTLNTISLKRKEVSSIILHNNYDDNYYLWVSPQLAKNTRAFELVEYSGYDAMSEQALERSNTAYSNLLTGTPAQVYKNVYNHLLANGFANEGAESAMRAANDSRISGIFLTYIILLIASPLFFALLLPGSEELVIRIFAEDIGWLDNKIYEFLIDRHEKQVEQTKLLKIEQEEAQKKKDAELMEINIKSHPAKVVITKLDLLATDDAEIVKKKAKLVEQLNIVDNIMGVIGSIDIELKFYFNTFSQGIDEFVLYAKTHNTNFDTPEELAMMNEALDLYLEIVNSFTEKYGSRDLSNIGVSLEVLRKKAAFDGLTNKDFNI